ncbi:MAG: hypothetical protein ACI92Z_001549 [Paracoccaceae bacterium]|jgi:hypothetical protein
MESHKQRLSWDILLLFRTGSNNLAFRRPIAPVPGNNGFGLQPAARQCWQLSCGDIRQLSTARQSAELPVN